MYHLSLTLETAGANVSLDEELLARAGSGELPGEVLRLWESPHPAVVLGRSSPESEVRRDQCRQDGVPVLRRASGGASVVIGPGCLMFAAVLDRRARPELEGVDRIHNFVLSLTARALASLADGVSCAGTSDLVVNDGLGGLPRKFSGNSLRVKRSHVLYHGTILYDFELELIGQWLATPARQPEYRQARDHGEFLTNFPAPRDAIAAALVNAWQAHSELTSDRPTSLGR